MGAFSEQDHLPPVGLNRKIPRVTVAGQPSALAKNALVILTLTAEKGKDPRLLLAGSAIPQELNVHKAGDRPAWAVQPVLHRCHPERSAAK
jgi:hypothetical protein